MTHQYEITGMSCTHCVARVQKALQSHPEITKAEVTLNPPQAIVTMKHHVETADLQQIIGKTGAYSIKAK